MLHYCVTGEKLSTSDVHNQNYADILPGDEADAQDAPMHDRYKTWMNEQVLLSMVREGNLNFKSAIDKSAVISAGVPVRGRDPMRQAKDSVIVFISLCTRAAIEGGMLPEQAYSLGDSYIQSVEDASTHSEIAALAYAMYEDFIRRVNKRRANPQIAKQIQKCCDYIDLHAEEKINVEDIAKRVGYTKYYLTRKFKEEMKCSLNDYIRQVRTERAKLLLTTTDLSIQDIADKLGFCSRSYFSEVFRAFAGCSPVDFRDQNKKG
jgi:AraC-like DNA-binding protein